MIKKLSQEERLIQAFKANNNVLSLPQILDLRPRISQYGRAIHKLRKQGYVIDNDSWHVEGERHSKFTLISEPKKFVSLPPVQEKEYPTRSHRIAAENREKYSQKTDQLTLI